MKKLLALVLASLLVFAIVACTDKDTQNDEIQDPVVENPAEDPVEDPVETPVEDNTEALTPAATLLASFKDLMATSEDKSPETLANALITNPIIPFAGGAMAVEPGFLQGFDADITGFDKGAVFMPMIGAIPFVGYVF